MKKITNRYALIQGFFLGTWMVYLALVSGTFIETVLWINVVLLWINLLLFTSSVFLNITFIYNDFLNNSATIRALFVLNCIFLSVLLCDPFAIFTKTYG